MTNSGNSGFDIAPVTIENEMKRSYLDYAMSVIVSRALPDVRDGLKPVHRRILFAMREGGYDSNKPFRKSARIVGDVMGQYHPHGDSAIYDAMVRMAQNFSMRLPLIDGQGNFGSMDGDPAAAMRYTEARLAKSAEALLEDIDKDTVSFQPNYDESIYEPTVLPARFPNLLVNGAGGIAVGMATNIPPHNLGEVVDACIAYIADPSISIEDLMDYVPGPDFPTGGQILGKAGIYRAYTTGNGSVIMRGKTQIEEMARDRQAIIISEVPYQVNKARLIERIAEVVREKIVEGISDLRDESDRDGVRVVIELKRDAVAEVVLAQLYKFTPLQTSFGCNVLALNNGRPQTLNLKEIIAAFVAFREEVITRRTIFELGKARDRGHILAGLAVAIANLDEIIRLIRQSPDPQTARDLMTSRDWPVGDVGPLIALIDDGFDPAVNTTYRMTEIQAKAILDLRLHRLTGLERDKIGDELSDVVARIKEYLDILGRRERLLEVMVEELHAVRAQFATPRRTELLESEFESDIEDLIQREEMVVTVSHAGYIKRVPLSTYRAQARGGKGRSGMTTKEEDFVTEIFVANTHTPILFFSTRGLVYKLKVYRLPLSTPQARGKAIINLLPLQGGEKITAVMPLPENEDEWGDLDVVFATSSGNIRRNRLSDFTNIRASGLIAMKLDEGEMLIAVRTCRPDDTILMTTRKGSCIRFNVEDVRVFSGRISTGVRGIRLEDGDEVISMSVLKPDLTTDADERNAYLKRANQLRRQGDDVEAVVSDEDDETASGDVILSDDRFQQLAAAEEFILTVSQTGLGKRTSSYEYRVTGRGGKGFWNMDVTERVKSIVASFPVDPAMQLMLVSDGGQVIRLPLDQIRIAGRRTQGVTLFRLADGESVVSVAVIEETSEETPENNGEE